MLFKLMAPENFEVKYPNYVRQRMIPIYHEQVVYPDNGIVSTKDPRTKEALEKMGFQTIFSSGVPTRPTSSSSEEETWEKEPESEIMFEDIGELDGPNLDYCKYCGKGFEEVPKVHVEEEHGLEWEEYERLPEMVPPLALKIYWASKELQEAFDQPLNLLCSHGMYANFLDFCKLELTKQSRKLAEYYGVAFKPTSKKNLIPEKAERDFEEYCKICGAQAGSIESHVVGHGIPMEEYRKLDRKIPDIVLDMWFKHKDLQRAFPEPCNLNKGHANFKNLVDWCRSDGVKKHPHLRAYFTGKKIEEN